MKRIITLFVIIMLMAVMAVPAYAAEEAYDEQTHAAEVAAEATETNTEEAKPTGTLRVVYHDPSVVAGRKTSSPETLTYSKVSISTDAESDIHVAAKLDTERSNDIIDPLDLEEANGIETFAGQHDFYVKDGQAIVLEMPFGSNVEIDTEDRQWFPTAYELSKRDEDFVSYTWLYPTSEIAKLNVDAACVDIDILPTIPIKMAE